MKKLEESIRRSLELAEFISDRLADLEIPTPRHEHIAAACFQVGLRHHLTIGLLLQQGHPTSGLALFRPLVEAYIRGAWVQFYASETQVDSFVRGKGLKAEKAVSDLETCEVFDSGRLTEIKKAIWSDLCDSTHCGGKTISSHFVGDDLLPNFSDEYLSNALQSADAWALMIANSISLLAGRHDIAFLFIERAKKIRT